MKFWNCLIFLLVGTFCMYAQETVITYINTDGSETSEVVSQDISKLEIFGGYIYEIRGLEKLTNLKTLNIEYGGFLEKDLSFLKDLKTVEVLILQTQDVYNTDFLSGWTNLKAVIFQGVSFYTDIINLTTNYNLEYFEMTNCHIDKLPQIYYNKDIQLAPINLSYNQLTKEGLKPALDFLKKANSIILDGNPVVDVEGYYGLESIEKGSVDDTLLEKYKCFRR